MYATLTKSTTGLFATTNTVGLVPPATSPKKATYAFPTTTGKLNSKTFAGRVSSKGGLNFSSTVMNPLGGSGTTQFEMTSFALHFGGSSQLLTATFVGSSSAPGAPFATLVTNHGDALMMKGEV